MGKDAQLTKLKDRIPFDSDKYISEDVYEKKLTELLEDSKNIALRTLYPFLEDFEGVELPKGYYNWQIRACEELYKWKGNAGIKSYSEAGLSWTKGNDGILSDELMDELVSHASPPKRRDSIDN